MKEPGRSTLNNTDNTRSLIRTLRYVPDIVADERSLFGERIHTHTHSHTHTQAHVITKCHKILILSRLRRIFLDDKRPCCKRAGEYSNLFECYVMQ